MGFSAMKLINEAGIGGAAVISVVQRSALSLVSSSDEGMGPFNAAAFPWGPQSQAALPALVLFPCGELPRASPGSLARIYLGKRKEKKKKKERERNGKEKNRITSPLFILMNTNFFHHCFGVGSIAKRTKIRLSRQLNAFFPWMQWSPAARIPV